MRLPDPARSRAVLIGAGSYTDPGLHDLPAIENNINDLVRVLTDSRIGGLRRERCTVLSDPTDERTVGKALVEAARQAEDVFLVYYAGHGLVGPRRNELYLALADTDPDALYYTALPFDGIREAFLTTTAATRILILDCCYSGRAIDEHMAGESHVLGQVEVAGTYTLTSAPANSTAFAPRGATHTAFTGQLLTLLRDGIPEGPELLTLGDAYKSILHTMTVQGLPLPQRCGTETADLLAFTRNPLHPRTPPKPQRPDMIAISQSVVIEQERELGPNHPDTFGARREHVYWTGKQGDPIEAIRLGRALIADEERVLGPDDRETLIGRFEVADCTAKLGNITEATRLFTALVADEEQALGADDQETLASRGKLARWTGAAGNAEEAARLYGALVTDQIRIFGADERRILETRYWLSHWTAMAGDSTAALSLLQELVSDQERLLGPDHRDTLESRSCLAQRVGHDNPIEAVRLSRAVLADRDRVLGPDDEDTLQSRFWLAYWTTECGAPSEAARLLSTLVSDLERLHERNYFTVLNARNELARATGQNNRFSEALRLYRDLLSDLERHPEYGPDDSMAMGARFWIVTYMTNLGDTDAVQLFPALLADYQRVYGPTHGFCHQIRFDWANFMAWLGDKAEATRLYYALIADYDRIYGPDDSATINLRQIVAEKI